MIIGKIVGALLGYSMGRLPGAVLGLIAGHLFDRGYERARQGLSPEERRRVQDSFFRTVFRLLGHLAKADGRVSEAEIRQTEAYMAQMGLAADHRREAIRLFKEGAGPGFDLDETVRAFLEVCGRRTNLIRLLLVYLIHVALADGRLDDSEEGVLRRVARLLGMPPAAFEQLIRMIRAQETFRGGAARTADDLELAYQALGVEPGASDAEVKRAYRRLMSEYHPDRLIGQGVPDDMIKEATERSQEIQAAYDLINRSRRGRG